MKNTQVKYTFSSMARSPTHLSPVVITLCSPTGAIVHSLHLFLDVSLPLFSHWGHQSRTEPTQAWITSLLPMCLLGHDWPSCSQEGSSLFAPSVVCCHPCQTYQSCEPLWCVCSQQCQRKGDGFFATRAVGSLPRVRQLRLLLLESEFLLSRLQRHACVICLEVAFLSADVGSLQPDCLMKQLQEWILLTAVWREECKIFTPQESKSPGCLTHIN